MKLAFCLFKYFPYGGMQRDFLQIAKECARRGHIVDVYTTQWEGDRDPDISVQVLLQRGVQNHSRAEAFVADVQPLLAEEKYDLVVGFNKMPGLDIYFAADTCYQAKAQEQHSWWYRFTPRYRHHVAYEQAVFSPEAKTEILLLSAVQQVEFTRYYRTPAKRFHLLPPGIDRSRIAPDNAAQVRASLRADYTISDDEFLLLMVGSGFKTKGLDRILAGMHALPPELKKRCQLFVIGKDDPERYERIAEKYDLERQVRFLGGRNDVPRFLLAADALLHPAYNENTGTVLLEAMVSGLPVLTVDTCGYAHYVAEAKAGIVLPTPFKQKDFNAGLVDILLSSKRNDWQQNGLAFAKRKDIYSMHQHAVDVIEAKSPLASRKPLLRTSPGEVYLAPELQQYFSANNLFDQIMSLEGEVFRDQKGRRTQRVLINGNPYFVKQHLGVGWKEIAKNLLQGRLPVLGAHNEWVAIQRAQQLGVLTQDVVGYGYRGLNPAKRESFLVTKEITHVISLEDYCKNWQKKPPSFRFKCAIIKEVARIARILHRNGVNHRDFYLCHFLLEQKSFKNTVSSAKDNHRPTIYLIDLHRAQIRTKTPERWMVKDLAGLYFSSKDIGLTRRDLFRFMKEYRKQSLRDILTKEATFWERVRKRGDITYQAHQSNEK